MKLKEIKSRDNVNQLEGEDFKVVLSPHILEKVISSTINDYSDIKGSIVRECVSNCFDAEIALQEALTLTALGLTKEEALRCYDKYQVYNILRNNEEYADDFNKCKSYFDNNIDYKAVHNHLEKVKVKVENPITIKLRENNIIFKDYGIGLSPERVKFIYTSLFVSTKTNSNNKIGAFGRGAKSPYAYIDNFIVETVFDGVFYKYLMTYNETSIPRMELLVKNKTNDVNGTSVIIPFIKKKKTYYYDSSTERDYWEEAVHKQTCFFTNIYYDGINLNDNVIYKGKYYSYSTKNTVSKIRILLGEVPYHIDSTFLTHPIHYSNFLINFDIGELQPTPNRESIILDDAAKQLIEERLRLAATELVTKANSQHKLMTNLQEFVKVKDYKSVKMDKDVAIDALIYYSKVPYERPTYHKLPSFTDTRFVSIFPRIIINRKLDKSLFKHHVDFDSWIFNNPDKVWFKLKKSRTILNKYLIENHPHAIHLATRKSFKLKDWVQALNLDAYPNVLEKDGCTWRRMIQEYIDFEIEEVNKLTSYDNYKVPKSFTPPSSNKPVAKGTIKAHVLRLGQSYTGVFDTKDIDINNFSNKTIYTTYQKEKDLKCLFPFLDTYNIISVSSKHIPLMSRFIELEDFFKSDEMKKYLTKVYIHITHKVHPHILNNTDFFSFLDKDIAKDVIDLNQYKLTAHNKLSGKLYKTYEKLVADKDWDSNMKDTVERYLTYIDTFKYLNNFKTTYSYRRDIVKSAYDVAKLIYLNQ